ncbi:hypothetical protein V2J09_002898 [Rumex salicifolius]
MASRLKEDEKNERIIRGLLKLPANRRCINCNSLGPQYVCTTFWTREFTHRVKSVSMAKFTPQEVTSLQSGGNELAKEIYFKELDSHRLPDSSNVDKLRDFIKHVYVDRRYTGERSSDKPPARMKMGDKDETNEHRRANSYGSGSRSPPYEGTYDRRYSDRPSPGYDGRRSPAYEQDNQRNSDYGRSPVHSVHGVVNDWRREDRFGNGRRSEDGRSPDGDSTGRSPDSQKDLNVSSPPVVRPVRDILGENVTPLRVIEPPKVISGKVSHGFPHTQRTASSSSLASSSGNPTEVKRVDSLIDFDADPVPPKVVATQPQESAAALTNTSSDNWACFDNVPEIQVSQPPPSLNALDSGLTQLSVPSLAPSNTATIPATLEDSLFGTGPQVSMTPSTGTTPPAPSTGHSTLFPGTGPQVSVTPSTGTTPPAPSTGHSLLFPSNGAYAATPSNVTLPNNITGIPAIPGGAAGQWSSMQPHQQPIYTGSQFSSSFTGTSSSQAQVSQSGLLPAQASSEAPAQPTGPQRRELPADIFTAMYAPQPVHAPGWHTGFAPHMGMAYPMQYNSAMVVMTHAIFSQQMPTFPPQSTKSANPFDVSGESPYTHSSAFPSMMPLQSALPNMQNSMGLVRTSSLDTAIPSWMPSQASAYPSGTPQSTPPFGTAAVTPGTYINQQAPGNFPSRPQGFGGFSNDAAGYNTMNQTHGFPGNLSAPTAPSSSGNPFG